MCFVRAREGDEIVLTTYGRSSGFCVDPIEKKPLNHFLPGSSVLSFGTAGCNLACRFCQNWDISKSKEIDTLADAASPDATRRGRRRARLRAASRSPTTTRSIFLEYAIDVADACHERGIHAVAVTAGLRRARSRARRSSRTWTPPTSTSRRSPRTSTATSAAAISATVLDTLEYLVHETDVWVEITNLLIPGQNDSDDGARRDDAAGSSSTSGPTCRCTSPRSTPTSRCSTSRTRPGDAHPRPRDRAAPTACATRTRATCTTATAASTRCAGCGDGRHRARLVRASARTASPTTAGAAAATRALAGRFDGPAGTWGARRMPVRLADSRCPMSSVDARPTAGGRGHASTRATRRRSHGTSTTMLDARPRPGRARRRRRSSCRTPGTCTRARSPRPATRSLARRARTRCRRVVLLGPAHYVPFEGSRAPQRRRVRHAARRRAHRHRARARVALALAGVAVDDAAHGPEHSLEVHLPFLQRALADFTIVPFVVGAARRPSGRRRARRACGAAPRPSSS